MNVIDVSVPLSPGLPVWPGDPSIVLERVNSIAEGSESNDSQLACSVHTGTHVDAPKHFVDDGNTIELLPMNLMVGPAQLVKAPPVDVITTDVLEGLAIPAGTIRLLIKTRNSNLWDQPNHLFNTEYVALSSEAAEWVVNRGIRLIGIDYLSVQLYSDKDPRTHQVLLEAGVIIVEGLDLRKPDPGRYQLICLPLKLVGSDGAPARVVLIEEE
jgi:arylformamidase